MCYTTAVCLSEPNCPFTPQSYFSVNADMALKQNANPALSGGTLQGCTAVLVQPTRALVPESRRKYMSERNRPWLRFTIRGKEWRCIYRDSHNPRVDRDHEVDENVLKEFVSFVGFFHRQQYEAALFDEATNHARTHAVSREIKRSMQGPTSFHARCLGRNLAQKEALVFAKKVSPRLRSAYSHGGGGANN